MYALSSGIQFLPSGLGRVDLSLESISLGLGGLRIVECSHGSGLTRCAVLIGTARSCLDRIGDLLCSSLRYHLRSCCIDLLAMYRMVGILHAHTHIGTGHSCKHRVLQFFAKVEIREGLLQGLALLLQIHKVIVELLLKQGGHARKGNGRNYKLGEPNCDHTTVVGAVAIDRGFKNGESVFDPVFVLAAVLEWAGIAHNERGELVLTQQYRSML